MKGTLLFNALREAIDEEMGRDPLVCVMGEDVGQYGGSYKVTKDLYEKYGEFRVLDTPCLLYTSPSPRDKRQSRMPSSA